MGQNERKTNKTPMWLGIGLAILVLVAAALIFGLRLRHDEVLQTADAPQASQTDNTPQAPAAVDPEPEETADAEPEEEAAPMLSFPILLEDGALTIESLYQYDGINPDCANQEGEDIAAIVLRNTSDTHLAEANITLTLPDAAAVRFTVTEIPAGASVMAFSAENAVIEEAAACVDAACEATFDPDASMEADKLKVIVSGMTITLTNQTQSDFSEVRIFCHNALSPDLFGGTTYQYVVNNLPAGASTTVDAFDCILGIAEVVRIEVQ